MSTAVPKRLEIRHPKKSPGTAAGVKKGRMHSASEMRNCTGPKLMGANIIVSATYTAAINAPSVSYTHLDVYKRQGQYNCGKKQLTDEEWEIILKTTP